MSNKALRKLVLGRIVVSRKVLSRIVLSRIVLVQDKKMIVLNINKSKAQ